MPRQRSQWTRKVCCGGAAIIYWLALSSFSELSWRLVRSFRVIFFGAGRVAVESCRWKAKGAGYLTLQVRSYAVHTSRQLL